MLQGLTGTVLNVIELVCIIKVGRGNLERGVTWNEAFLSLLTPEQELLDKDN